MIRWRLCWWWCRWGCQCRCRCRELGMQIRGRGNWLRRCSKIHVSFRNIKRSIIGGFCGKNMSVKLLWSGFRLSWWEHKLFSILYPTARFVNGDYSQSICAIRQSSACIWPKRVSTRKFTIKNLEFIKVVISGRVRGALEWSKVTKKFL